MRKFFGFYFMLAASLITFALANSPAQALEIDNIRIGVHSDKTRIVLDMDSAQKFRTFTLVQPNRLVIDLPSFSWDVGTVGRPAGSNILDIRQGSLNSNVSRIVIDLKNPALIKSAYLLKKDTKNNKPDRLVIDFVKASQTEFINAERKVFGILEVDDTDKTINTSRSINKDTPTQTKVSTPSDTQRTQTPNSSSAKATITPQRKPKQNTVPSVVRRKPIVIIDPGHGGADPGAIGSNGIFEKNITLAISRELKKQLEATGRYKVKMTRNSDVYLKLYKRVEFARNNGGDLFISIHADSLPKSKARGASIYTLSEKASDAQTAKLAQRENNADKIAGVDLTHEDDQVADILVDLVMRDTQNQSNFFANTLVSTIQSSQINLLQNPHRYAGFAVLKAPDIPSVLVEAGFLSNAAEARQLSQASYRKKIAVSLKDGINRYFDKVDQYN